MKEKLLKIFFKSKTSDTNNDLFILIEFKEKKCFLSFNDMIIVDLTENQKELITISLYEKTTNKIIGNIQKNISKIFQKKNHCMTLTFDEGKAISLLFSEHNDQEFSPSNDVYLYNINQNLLKFHEVKFNLFSLSNPENNVYQIKIVYTKNLFIESNYFDSVINTALVFIIPIIPEIKKFTLILFKNNENISEKEITIADIQSGVYSNLQYLPFKTNALLFSSAIQESSSSQMFTFKTEINQNLLEKSKQIGKKILWKIFLEIKEIFILPYDTILSGKDIKIITKESGVEREIKQYKKEIFEYQTVNESITELPEIYVEAFFEEKKMKFSGLITLHKKKNFVKLVSDDKNLSSSQFIIIKYETTQANTCVKISLVDISHDLNTEDSFCSVKNLNKEEKDIQNIQKNAFVISIHSLEFLIGKKFNKNLTFCIFVSINSITQSVLHISSETICKKVFFPNICPKHSVISFTVLIENAYYHSSFLLEEILNYDSIVINGLGKLNLKFEKFSDESISTSAILISTAESYYFDFFSVGVRNYNIDNSFITLSIPKISLNLNDVVLENRVPVFLSSSGSKGSNSSISLKISEEIPLNLDKSSNLRVNIIDNSHIIGSCDINISEVISQTKSEIEKIFGYLNSFKGTNPPKEESIVLQPKKVQYKLPGINENDQYFKYYFIEDKAALPDASLFKKISEKNGKFHYRRFYNFILEDPQAMNLQSPFKKFKINPLKGEYFKCLVNIFEKEQKEEYEKFIQSISNNDLNEFEVFKWNHQVKEELEKKVEAKLIIYLCDLYIKGEENESITIKIKINDQVREEFTTEKCVAEIKCVFHGDCILQYDLYKKGKYFSSSQIIDIEDRYYNYTWRHLKEKPIEKISFADSPDDNYFFSWLDIDIHAQDLESNKYYLESPLKAKTPRYQLRIVVYQCEFLDTINSINKITNDLYIKAYTCKERDIQFSDIHYHSNGYGYFNWRFIFDLQKSDEKIYFEVNDYGRNEQLCSCCIDLEKFICLLSELQIPLKLNEEMYKELYTKSDLKLEFVDSTTFWIELLGGNVNKGRMKMEIEVLPFEMAEKWSVGRGREEPNINPVLRYPYERYEIKSLFGALEECAGEQTSRKLKKAFILFLVALYFIFLVPYLIYHLAGEAVNPFNYVLLHKVKK